MKALILIIIFAIIGYSFTEEEDQCIKEFEVKLQTQCTALDTSCVLTNFSPRCISKNNNNCSKGNGDQKTCLRIFLNDFPLSKCVYNNNICEKKDSVCSDFNSGFYGITFNEDKGICAKLKPENGKDKCRIADNGSCQSYYDSCTGLDNRECTNNLLENFKKQCYFINGACVEGDRLCDNELLNVNEDQCHQLSATDSLKKCVYSNEKCLAEYKTCEEIPSTHLLSCSSYTPLKKIGNYYYFNYINICRPNSVEQNKCKTFKRNCLEYRGDDESICTQLEATVSYKRCAYNSLLNTDKCYEEFKSCQDYNDNVSSKNRGNCEKIVLPEENKKCIYITEIDKCVEIENGIYKTCQDYTGTDKYTCESIKSTNINAYCILDADSKCIERNRNFTCSEAYDEENCLYYAKPIDSNKKCAFDDINNKCVEVYERCEDYIENNPTYCQSLILYNGKKCAFEDRCISKDKICHEAITKGECKLIANTGVSDPTKNVCDYISSKGCIENYKYCSDYRGDQPNICRDIKPYNESGNYIDKTAYCDIIDNLCQRVSKDCNDAGGNAIHCALISPNIKDNHINHCVFDNGYCRKYKKKCEDTNSLDCTNNIPENHLNYHCSIEMKDGVSKCVAKKNCASFKEDYYANLCYEINPNCTYSNKVCSMKEVYLCNQKIFFEARDENEEICKTLDVSSPNKICVLNEDKSACEEIFKDSSYSDSEPLKDENSSRCITIGIHLISFLLYMLI